VSGSRSRFATVTGVWELRSDTFTRPDDAMRAAMAAAEVGDDVWGEDPTVNRLEQQAAALVGTEAAVFVASGTMGNAIGVGLHTERGSELYAHARSHIVENEAGGAAALWGASTRQLPGEDGFFDAGTLAAWLPPDDDDPHHAAAQLVCIEDTSMAAMGAPWPLDQLQAVAALAHRRGLKLHLDGARLFNAACAQDVAVDAICRHVDTVTFCLSKGLGAPLGSLVCGSAADVRRARRLRKLLGGGMRQAGVVAAAGIHALEHNVTRLRVDHANARRLAEGLAGMPRVEVTPERVVTNVVFAACARSGDTADAVCADLATVGVMAAAYDQSRVRLVTSLEVDGAGIEDVIRAASRVLG
jgi:threonine aldolase